MLTTPITPGKTYQFNGRPVVVVRVEPGPERLGYPCIVVYRDSVTQLVIKYLARHFQEGAALT